MVGWIMLNIWIGQCRMECKVYVKSRSGFRSYLAHSLWEDGLIIDTYNEALYTSPALRNGKMCSAALQCKRTPKNINHSVQQVGLAAGPA